MKGETLYRKVGRRYEAAYHESDWDYGRDRMAVGTFRLMHAYGDGGTRYAHDVTPDTAGWAAAAMLALHEMAEAMHKASQARPSSPTTHYTRKQLQALEKAKAIMQESGLLLPAMWQHQRADDIAQAGIDAVLAYARNPKTLSKQ